MNISRARTAAFDILMRIEKDGSFSSALLPQFEEVLSEKDRALCHELTLGVLRRKLYLDAIIDSLSKGKRIDLEIRVSLWLGLFQLIELDRIPAHAAIDESVNLVLRAKKRSAKGFVNAVLRTFQRDPLVPQFDNSIEELCITTSHPQWLVERWIGQFGFEQTEGLCKANNERPVAAFRILQAENGQSGNDNIYFQDEGSQLVANAVIAEGGKLVLDVCAAPGGKTTMIAGGGATRITAGDVHPNRIRLLSETCERLRCTNVDIVRFNATQKFPFSALSFDTVFVDAPCSGTGTIRHNPEIRYSLTYSDIQELSRKQLTILQNASEQVRKGGELVYSTCSLEREENELICEDFVRANPQFTQSEPRVPDRFLTPGGFARTFPQRDQMDGFFIAVFERI